MTDETTHTTSTRPRGRPRNTPLARTPRYPELEFSAERRLLEQLRKTDTPAMQAYSDAAIKDLAHLAEQPLPGVPARISMPSGQNLRFALDRSQREIAADYVAERAALGISGLAPNSRRGLASDWLNWLAFCMYADAIVLPTSFLDLKRFIDMLVAGQRKKATIEHHVWAITEVNRRYGCPDPMASELARDYWRDLLRDRLDGEQKQATGLGLDQIQQMVAALRDPDLVLPARRASPKHRQSIAAAQRRRALRDAALINAAYDLAMRSAELIALRWDRIFQDPDGSGAYRMGKSKTDQLGQGQLRYLRPETMADIEAWRVVAGPSPFVFHRVLEENVDHLPVNDSPDSTTATESAIVDESRCWPTLTTREIGVIYKRAGRLIGIAAPTFSGHSTRVGATQDLIESGGTTEEAQQMGGWRDGRMVARYAERPLAKRAGQGRFGKLARHRER
ncbi:tyrosine-type recombinase/integrase [Frateuria aurantia]